MPAPMLFFGVQIAAGITSLIGSLMQCLSAIKSFLAYLIHDAATVIPSLYVVCSRLRLRWWQS